MSGADERQAAQWTEARRWFAFGDEDLRTAEVCLAGEPPLLGPGAYRRGPRASAVHAAAAAAVAGGFQFQGNRSARRPSSTASIRKPGSKTFSAGSPTTPPAVSPTYCPGTGAPNLSRHQRQRGARRDDEHPAQSAPRSFHQRRGPAPARPRAGANPAPGRRCRQQERQRIAHPRLLATDRDNPPIAVMDDVPRTAIAAGAWALDLLDDPASPSQQRLGNRPFVVKVTPPLQPVRRKTWHRLERRPQPA